MSLTPNPTLIGMVRLMLVLVRIAEIAAGAGDVPEAEAEVAAVDAEGAAEVATDEAGMGAVAEGISHGSPRIRRDQRKREEGRCFGCDLFLWQTTTLTTEGTGAHGEKSPLFARSARNGASSRTH